MNCFGFAGSLFKQVPLESTSKSWETVDSEIKSKDCPILAGLGVISLLTVGGGCLTAKTDWDKNDF